MYIVENDFLRQLFIVFMLVCIVGIMFLILIVALYYLLCYIFHSVALKVLLKEKKVIYSGIFFNFLSAEYINDHFTFKMVIFGFLWFSLFVLPVFFYWFFNRSPVHLHKNCTLIRFLFFSRIKSLVSFFDPHLLIIIIIIIYNIL